MRKWIREAITKVAMSTAALAVICAVSNVHSTCIFLAYQPDVPEELQ